MLRLGSRTMPVLDTHLIPATFGGRARMNVANALAAAAAAWASGAHLHDIRQGLRTFSTSFFQAPGRLNLIDVGGVRVVIDYCHNVDGMRQLADFVNRMMVEAPTRHGRVGAAATGTRSGRAIGVLGIPGDRRDDDQRQYGAIAAGAFDEIIVREDKNLRGRTPGETASNVIEGVREAKAAGTARSAVPRRSSRDVGGPGGAAATRATSWCAASTTRSRGLRGDVGRGHIARREGVRGPSRLEARGLIGLTCARHHQAIRSVPAHLEDARRHAVEEGHASR